MKRFVLISLLLLGAVWFLTAQPIRAQSPLLPEGPARLSTRARVYLPLVIRN